MLARLRGPGLRQRREEAEALAEQAGFPIEPWDWAFYAEKVRKARYDFDETAMRPYFELGRVIRDGVFHAADAAVRDHLHRAARPGGLPPGRARLRGVRRRRLAARPVPRSTPTPGRPSAAARG